MRQNHKNTINTVFYSAAVIVVPIFTGILIKLKVLPNLSVLSIACFSEPLTIIVSCLPANMAFHIISTLPLLVKTDLFVPSCRTLILVPRTGHF